MPFISSHQIEEYSQNILQTAVQNTRQRWRRSYTKRSYLWSIKGGIFSFAIQWQEWSKRNIANYVSHVVANHKMKLFEKFLSQQWMEMECHENMFLRIAAHNSKDKNFGFLWISNVLFAYRWQQGRIHIQPSRNRCSDWIL